jgi:hypothetical protein
MKIFNIGLLTLAAMTLATGSASADGAGPWSAIASHLDQSSSTPTVAQVIGDGPNWTFSASGPGDAEHPSRGTVSASTAPGAALTSLEGYSITLSNPVSANPTEDSGFFLDTLSKFQSKTGLMSGNYIATFKESTGFPDSTVIGGILVIDIVIDYPTLPDDVYTDSINFGTSDCPYYQDICKTSRTFGLKEVPTSITVSMELGTRFPGGLNQAPHDYQGQLALAFGEILPCGDVFCLTPVTYTSAFAGVPEPATWALMLGGFAGLACAGHFRARRGRCRVAASS